MHLLAIGLNHTTAPVSVRERVAFGPEEIAETIGVSINTALGRMRYAILNLRRMARKSNMSLEVTFN